MRTVLGPFFQALRAARRLFTVGKPTQAPRAAQAPHAPPASGIQWSESGWDDSLDDLEARYRRAYVRPSRPLGRETD